MHDQANLLRGLMERRSPAFACGRDPSSSESRCRTVTVTSGKGGAGKSSIALNLAVALAREKQSVLLLDVNWGVGSLELLAGLSGRWNVSHVISGTKRLDEVILNGPEGVRIVSGVGRVAQIDQPALREEIFQQIAALKQNADFLIVDFGTGIQHVLPRFLETVDRVICLSTTESTSIAETYAAVKSLAGGDGPVWEVLINQSESAQSSESLYQRLRQTTRVFLKTELTWAGTIPKDSHVPLAVVRRIPFLLEAPYCQASEAVKLLAKRLINQRQTGRQNTQSSGLAKKWSSPDERKSQAIYSA